jgi:predicted naringenin-chalcone synthase
MTWRIGDHGFEMTLSPRVPGLIERHLRSWLEPWLGRQGLARADIGSWAIHPGGPRVIAAVETALGLDEAAADVSRQVLASCGNMSSSTLLFIVERLIRADAPRPCVALAFGPGLVVEAALLT